MQRTAVGHWQTQTQQGTKKFDDNVIPVIKYANEQQIKQRNNASWMEGNSVTAQIQGNGNSKAATFVKTHPHS